MKQIVAVLVILVLTTSVLAQEIKNLDSDANYTISQASYKGELINQTVFWSAEYQIDVFASDPVNVPLLPDVVIVSRLELDKKIGTILEIGNKIVARISGAGRHNIVVDFQLSINQEQGLPGISLSVPRVPINKLTIKLPGKKQLKISPKSAVKYRYTKHNTFASLNLPMSKKVHLEWAERLPDAIQNNFRANAEIYHLLSAEQGLMKAVAEVKLNVKQGSTKVISLVMPANILIDQVSVPFGSVLDWVVGNANNDKQKILRIYLDHAINSDYSLTIQYEKFLNQITSDGRPFLVPLLRVLKMDKHIGMVSIVSDSDLLLEPVSSYNLFAVGQNQLPDEVQNQIYHPILHTYKYNAKYPKLHVKTHKPKFMQGKYDVQINSLYSLNTEKLSGKAILNLNIKSGYVRELMIYGAQDINLLSITGPGVDTYSMDAKTIKVKFDQSMQGQLKLAIEYEKYIAHEFDKISIPILYVKSADDSSGNIAIVSLLAANLTATNTNTLTKVHIQDLSQQLTQQTNNPIVFAYKYDEANTQHEIEIQIPKHQEVNLQDAVIKNAQYQTLITNDGLIVTKARLAVQNNNRQFLRVKLPGFSKIWSVYIDGNKKNLNNVSMDNPDDPDTILVSLNKSQAGLLVDIVYATPSDKLDMYGAIDMNLPVPDLLVNQTNWDLYLPVGLKYYGIDTNMNMLAQQRYANPRSNALNSNESEADSLISIFESSSELTIPSQGIHYAFNRLYANQVQDPTHFSIYYASEFGYKMAERISVISVILIWIGLIALRFSKPPLNQSTAYTILVIGVISLAFTLIFLHADSLLPTIVAVVGSLVYVYFLIMQQRQATLN